MKRFTYLLSLGMFATVLFAINACKKTEALTIPPSQAHFMTATGGTYQITAPGVVYKIPIGLTTVDGSSKTINVSVSSKTGAIEGTHYSLNTKSLTLVAGKAVDTIIVSGVFAQYQAGRKDTLVFTLSGDGIATSEYNPTFTLAMRGPCFEGEITTDYAQVLPGTYAALESAYRADGSAAYVDYGPYPSIVKDVTMVTPTSVRVRITDIYEVAGWEANFTLDFSNLADRRVITTSQPLGSGAAIGLAAYNISIEPPSAAQNPPAYGNYTFCSNRILIKFRLGARDPGTGALLGYLTSGGQIATYTMALSK